MQEQFQAIVAGLRSAWRFRWHAVLLMWTLAILGWAAVFLMPSKYEATARIFVDTNSILKPLLDGIAVGDGTTNQVELVRNALLGREQLGQVIEATDLKKSVTNQRQKEALIRDLLKNITISSDSASPRTRDANMFSIAYRASNPDLAYSVVQTLLREFVSQSVGANRQDADAAQNFLRTQIADYEKRLTQSESRLAEFKKQNLGAMPDERGGYFGRLQSETVNLDGLRERFAVAQQKRDVLRKRLLGEATDSAGGPSAVETSVDARIRTESARLEELLLRFTDDHPDVIALRATIVRLQQQRRQELESLRASGATSSVTSSTTNLVTQNLQISLNDAEADFAALRTQVAEGERRVTDLKKQINVLPGVEAELTRLNRDYDVTKREYERLLQRFETAKLSDAADRVDEVKFRTVDPPVRPLVPVSPKRILLILAVGMMALGGGGGLAWLLSQLRPVFARPVEAERLLGMTVVAAISTLPAARSRAWPGLILVTILILGLCAAVPVLIAGHVHIELLVGAH